MVVVGCCEDPFRPPLRGASLAMVVGKVVVVVQSDCNCNGDGQWWSRLNPSYYVFSGTPWDMRVNVTVFASYRDVIYGLSIGQATGNHSVGRPAPISATTLIPLSSLLLRFHHGSGKFFES